MRKRVPPDACLLVTGASSGVGLALAKLLVANTKYRLVLTARASSMDRFAEEGITPNERLWLAPLDITDAQMRTQLVDSIEKHWGGVDVLINNAGVSYRSVVEHMTEEHRLLQMDVNFRSPMELVRLILPSMRAKKRGHIINVSSVGGMMAMPTMSVYSASKFALEGATESLWYEVRPFGIDVTLLQPGFINSESFKRARLTELGQAALDAPDAPYHQHYRQMTKFVARVMAGTRSSPESVARKVLKTVKRRWPPLRVSGTFDAFLFAALRRLMPRRLYHAMLYHSLPGIRRWGKDSSNTSQALALKPPQVPSTRVDSVMP